MTNPLIFIPKIKPRASIRLICFSYAGGNSATYLSWSNELHSDVELAVVQLPGRGIRFSDTPYQTMSEIVNALILELEKMSSKPCIFYGHSMGACVAYELTLMLHRFHYSLPLHFIASGSVAPCAIRTREQIYNLPDDEFIRKLGELNGSHPEVLADTEIMQLMLPALRADFKIIERYYNKNSVVIPTRVSVLAGDQEQVDVSDIDAWFTLFEACTDIHWISGGHFFIETNKADVLRVVNTIIEEHLPQHVGVREIYNADLVF